MDPNWCFYWGTPQNHSKLYILKYLQQGNRWLGDFTLLRNIWPLLRSDTGKLYRLMEKVLRGRKCDMNHSPEPWTRVWFGISGVCLKMGYTMVYPHMASVPGNMRIHQRILGYPWISHFQTQNFHCQGMEFQPGIFESNEARHWYFFQLQGRKFHSHLQGVKVYKEKRPPQEAADGQEAPTKGGGYMTEKNLVCPNPCYNIMLFLYIFFNSIVTAKR